MEFTQTEIEKLGRIRDYIHDKAIGWAETPPPAVDDKEVQGEAIADILIQMDILEDDFSNLEILDTPRLQMILAVLQGGIPDGMEPQEEYDRHMVLIGKIAVILKLKINKS